MSPKRAPETCTQPRRVRGCVAFRYRSCDDATVTTSEMFARIRAEQDARPRCSRCKVEPRRAEDQRLCTGCHAENMRTWRAKQPKAPQRARRSKA